MFKYNIDRAKKASHKSHLLIYKQSVLVEALFSVISFLFFGLATYEMFHLIYSNLFLYTGNFFTLFIVFFFIFVWRIIGVRLKKHYQDSKDNFYPLTRRINSSKFKAVELLIYLMDYSFIIFLYSLFFFLSNLPIEYRMSGLFVKPLFFATIAIFFKIMQRRIPLAIRKVLSFEVSSLANKGLIKDYEFLKDKIKIKGNEDYKNFWIHTSDNLNPDYLKVEKDFTLVYNNKEYHKLFIKERGIDELIELEEIAIPIHQN